MCLNVIYSINIPFSEARYFVDYLENEFSWKPISFFGIKSSIKEWRDKCYPDIEGHDDMSIRLSHFDYSRLGKPIPVDTEIINTLSKYEVTYLNWLEDTSGWNFSISERRRYYYDLLKYWNTVINKLKPDLFVSFNWPHTSDYILYLLCKHYYAIPVLFLHPIPYLEDDYYVIGESLENLSTQFRYIYDSNEVLKLSNSTEKYLLKLRSNNPEIPKYVRNYYNRINESQVINYKKTLISFLHHTLKGLSSSNMAFKKNQKPWESDSSKLMKIEYLLFRLQLTRKIKKLKKFYNNIAAKPNLNKKYLYFAAPYQPEALSNLFAGVDEDVFLVLDIITDIIPKDWLIYYKEHPSTFKATKLGGLANEKAALERSNAFYQKISSYKKIRIIPTTMDTFTMIDNSQAVCTIGGTVAWESVVRGKPALFFGSVWYQGCKSIFVIKSYRDAKEAIEAILSGYTPDRKDVDRYAESICRSCSRGLMVGLDYNSKLIKSKDTKHEMERLAIFFHDAYKRSYKANCI
jgi:hypothetical protein